jgi:putative PIG3 family NAD(P)H quinone oxidoreductase
VAVPDPNSALLARSPAFYVGIMKAVIVDRPGGPAELRVGEVPEPELAPGSVRIAVRAAALNRADLLQRRGLYPPPPGASEILGLECAGVVEAVASDVSDVQPGARVMALLSGGGYAERAVCPAGALMPIPERLSFTQAAAIPEAFLTAYEALFSLGRLERGERVLIHAAASGVGSAALQLAREVGAVSIATAGSPDKLDFARRLGAAHALDYHAGDLGEAVLAASEQRGIDVALDFIGASYAACHLRCLTVKGRWVLIGLLGGSRIDFDLGTFMRKRLQLLGLIMRTRSAEEKRAVVQGFSQRFLPALERGSLEPMVDRVYPLSEVRAAHERMEGNQNLGKIVLELGA